MHSVGRHFYAVSEGLFIPTYKENFFGTTGPQFDRFIEKKLYLKNLYFLNFLSENEKNKG